MATSVFSGVRKQSERFNRGEVDQEGRQIEVESREDEEQNVKLQETVELLLAAGYFRARIKGLSPFDKIVGGMTWCITTCSIDLDIDLLFQENSTIGQKIALTEKIVAVLPRMKCPHRLEPHQIQGLDFIHIFPVVQWLVKQAIETREEMGDYIRSFSESQFNKEHLLPQDVDFEQRKVTALPTVENILEIYRPQRRYKRPAAGGHDEETQVYSTLLEYGRRYGMSRTQKTEKQESSAKKKALAASLAGKSAAAEEEDEQALEEKRVRKLMKGMAAAEDEGVSQSAVGSFVGMQVEDIQKMASEYADLHDKLMTTADSAEHGGAQAHKRAVASLEKQIAAQEKHLEEISAIHAELEASYNEAQATLSEARQYSDRLAQETAKLDAMETDENREVLQKLRGLIALNESLKRQEQEFKTHCKEEMTRLKTEIAKLSDGDGGPEDQERRDLIAKQYETDQAKMQKIRQVLARRNRQNASLQRKIDEVPSRTELSQYQRRFVELYNQVASTLTETRQFYTLYNSLDDTKLYLQKEVNLLNSIHDNFQQAMASEANKKQFLKQMEGIVDGIKANKSKVDKRRQDEKGRRDESNERYLQLVDQERLYYKTVRDFQEECSKNDTLIRKLRAAGKLD
eukprot:scpid63955/ scgid7041/ Coiled-coil domain-containing protein 93